jgi:hypothetical protein
MSPTWDLVLIVFFIVSCLYGLLLRERVVVTLLGTYAAVLITERWGESIYKLLASGPLSSVNKGSISIFAVQIILLVLILLVISLKGGILIHPSSVGRGLMAHGIMAVYGVLAAALLASSVISFLPPATQTTMLAASPIARFVFDHTTWWLILPIIMMLVLNLKGIEN